jgi:hypothetical protein
MTADKDAIKIGELFRSAREGLRSLGTEPPVTDARKIRPELLSSRNADGRYRTTPDACHWCREPFAPGQMRYPIVDAVEHSGGWGITSVCMACFKAGHDCSVTLRDSITRLERINTKCAGCGEPIQTVIGARKGHWDCCSNRCYQRQYRKRRRGVGSVIPWRLESRKPRCEACSQPVKASRRDARYCSNRCRQWHYRQRHRIGIG